MKVIHFTQGATDRLHSSGASQARFVPLARGGGQVHVSCLHLLLGAIIPRPPTEEDCALLIVSGRVMITVCSAKLSLELSEGVGVVLKAGESYSLTSEQGAIAISIHATGLQAMTEAILTPVRIMGQSSSDDAVKPS